MEVPAEILFDAGGIFAATTGRGSLAASPGPYDTFSVCHYTGDDPAHVSACRRALCQYIGAGDDALLIPRQTHSVNVLTIRDDGAPVASEALEGVDAVVTDRPGIVIGVNTADCVPLILIDSRRRIVAAVHAGWRGAVAGIPRLAVGAMQALGSQPADIQAFIAPCIMVDDFEVGEEVAAQFPSEFVSHGYGVKPHVDLPGYVAAQLSDCGVTPCAMPWASTLTARDRYFSARALGIASGRNFTFVTLRNSESQDSSADF